MKRCSKCKAYKPHGSFNRKSFTKDGLQSACRDCTKQRDRIYYQTNDKRTSSGVRAKKWREDHPKMCLVYKARERARRKNIPCTIGPEDFEIPDHCPVLGIELRQGKGKPEDNSPTLDRLIPELGYVPGNVFVVSNRANRMKLAFELGELEALVAWWRSKLNK